MAQGFVLTANLNINLPPNLSSVVNQLNSKLKGVNVNVGVNVSNNANRQLGQLNNQLANVGKQAKISATSVEGFANAVSSSIKRFTGFAVVAGTFYTISRAINRSIDDAIDFQNELVKIRQVTGVALKDLQGLTDEVTRLSTSLGVNSNKLLNSAQVLAQAGLSADKTRIALEALAKTDVSPTFDNLSDTTEGAIAIMAQFGKEAEDLEEVFGSLNAVAGKFAVESSDIITAVRRTGGAFEAAGGELNELIALFTSVRQTTRESAESIATGFRTIFTRIQRTRTIGFLEDLGIQLRDLEGNFIGPYEAINRLSTALKDLDTTDPRFAQIIEELGGFRQVSKVIPLIKEFGTAQEALLVAQRGANSLNKDAEKSSESLSRQIAKVNEEFQALIRSFGEDSNVKAFISNTLKLASALIKLTEALKPIIPLIGIIAGSKFGNLVAGSYVGTKRTLGFNRGGLVPGSGSGDTVPAMLEPGEFVLRKNAVQALGVSNVANLNRKRFNHAGGVNPTGQTGGFSSNDISKIVKQLLISDPTFAQTMQSLDSKAFTKFNNELNDRKRGGAILASPSIMAEITTRLGTKEQKQLTSENRALKAEKDAANISIADQLVPRSQRTFGLIGLSGETGIKEGPQVGTTVTYDGKGVKIPYRLISVAFPEKTKDDVLDKAFIPNVKKGIEAGATFLQSYLGSGPLKEEPKLANERGILGSLFESTLFSLGAPYTGEGDSRNIDFRKGLGADLVKKFGPAASELEYRPTDAKLVSNEGSRGDLTGKINTYYQEYINQNNLLRKASGGGVGSDTVPALLTPGEFVINRDAAKAIGLGELHRLNKADKVQKFASGGLVGGGGIGFGATLALTVLPQMVSSMEGLTETNKKLLSVIASVTTQFVATNFLLGQLRQSISSLNFTDTIARDNTNKDRFNTIARTAAITQKEEFDKNNKAQNRLNRITSAFNQIDTVLQGAKRTSSNTNLPSSLRLRADQAINRLQPVRDQLIPQILVQRGLVDSISKNIIALEDQKTSALSAAKASEENVKQLQKFEFGLQAAQAATALFSAAALTFAQSFKETGIKAFKDGNFERGRSQLVTGGSLQGAGQGFGVSGGIATIAAGGIIGVQNGGLWGAVAGAAIGAAIVGVSTLVGAEIGRSAAEKMAADLKQEAIFTEGIKSFENAITAISNDKLSARIGAGNIATGTNVLLDNLRNTSAESKETAQARINDNIIKLTGFLDKLASSSKSIDDFQAIAGDTLQNFAKFTDAPVEQVINKYKEQIKEQTKSNGLQAAINTAQERQIQRLREFNSLTAAVKDAVLAFDSLSVSLDTIESFAGGGSGSSKFIDRSEIFDRLGSVANPEQFEKITNQIASNLGPGGNILRNEVIAANNIAQNLPSLLSRVVADSPNDADALALRFQQSLEGQPDFIKQILTSNLNKEILGPEQKDERFFSDLRDNTSELADKLLAGSIKDIANFFKEQAQLFNEHNNKIAGILEKQRALEGQFTELRQKSIDIAEAQADFNRGVNGKEITFANAQGLDAARRNAFGVGPNTTINSASQQIIDLQKSITENEVKLQNAEGKERDGLLQTLAKERNEVDRLTKFLNFMGDATQRNANLLRIQTQFQQERDTRRGIAEDFVFGGPDARRSLILGAAGAGQLAQTGDINSVPAFAQSEAFSFLQRLGDVKLGILGGESGNDVIKKTITEFLKSSGLTEAEAKDVAGLAVSRPEQLIVDAINQNFKDAAKVATEQKTIFENIRDLLQKQFDNSTQRFEIEKELNNKLVEKEVLDNTLKQKTTTDTRLVQEKQTFDDIKKLTKNNSDLAVNVLNRKDILKSLKEEADKARTIRPVSLTNSKEAAKLIETARDEQSFKFFTPKLARETATKANQNVISQLTGNNTNFLTKDGKLRGENFDNLIKAVSQNQGEQFGIFLEKKLINLGNISEGLSPEVLLDNLLPIINQFNQSGARTIQGVNEKVAREAKVLNLTPSELADLFQNLPQINKLASNLTVSPQNLVNLGDKIDTLRTGTGGISELNGKLQILNLEIKDLTDALAQQDNKIPKFATGGKVPGSGSRDSVLAKVMPGEFILNKKAAAAIGDEELFGMNKMARGGRPRITAEQYQARQKARRDAFAARKNNPIQQARERRLLDGNAFRRNQVANLSKDEKINILLQGTADIGLVDAIEKSLKQPDRGQSLTGQAAADEFARRKNTSINNVLNNSLEKVALRKSKVAGTNVIGGAIQQLFNVPSILPKSFKQTLSNKIAFNDDEKQPSDIGELFGETPRNKLSNDKYVRFLQNSQRYGLSYQDASKRLREIIEADQRIGFANGGYVPGQGNTDSVPALLMPGEFVMNKAAVQSIGLQKLDKANRQGRQKMAEGGPVSGSTSLQSLNIDGLNSSFSKFDASVSKLATAFEAMPHTISMNVRHTVEVIFNGAEVLKTLQPSIESLVVKQTEKAINTMLKDKFPDVGTVQ